MLENTVSLDPLDQYYLGWAWLGEGVPSSPVSYSRRQWAAKLEPASASRRA